MLGEYPERKKERKRPSAWLLCCPVSKIQMKSPQPSFGAHHCHCAWMWRKKKREKKEKKRKKRKGWREREGSHWLGAHSLLFLICHQQCLAPVPTSCSSHRALQKEQRSQWDWRQIIKGHCTPSETTANSPKRCLNEILHVLGISSRLKAPLLFGTQAILPFLQQIREPTHEKPRCSHIRTGSEHTGAARPSYKQSRAAQRNHRDCKVKWESIFHGPPHRAEPH